MWPFDTKTTESGSDGCDCTARTRDEQLILEAATCPASGRFVGSPACRATAVRALAETAAETVRVRTAGTERIYEGRGGALLLAAGRFVDRVCAGETRLAARAARDPLAAAREATGRADRAATVAAEVGLAEVAAGLGSYETAFAPTTGITVSRWRVDAAVPDGRLRSRVTLPTGAVRRVYDADGDAVAVYHLRPVARDLDGAARRLLSAAAERLGDPDRPDTGAREAVREAAGRGVETDRIGSVLARHAEGYGLLEHVFADTAVSDAFLTAPTAENPLRVVVDGCRARTNLRLSGRGVRTLATRLRAESGRAFSRAEPTLDAAVTVADRQVRVAGVRPPASDGLSFAFRAHDDGGWRLGGLVANETLSPGAAALLSVSVARGRSVLIAGPRGAGKTTLLGALLWELPADVRVVVIEDTRELPVGSLRSDGRDVQAVSTGSDGGELSPAEALRTALRLGEGALVVGEVRGDEAGVLFEAMRVGANSEATLGTVHGDGAAAAFERLVTEHDVSRESLGATDAVVTVTRAGDGTRHVGRVEEVVGAGPDVRPLFEWTGDRLSSTGRIERGGSQLVADLAAPGGSYERVRTRLATERDRLGSIRGDLRS